MNRETLLARLKEYTESIGVFAGRCSCNTCGWEGSDSLLQIMDFVLDHTEAKEEG